MPKSIIREYDNSTAGTTVSLDFSVVVPGYALINAAEEVIKVLDGNKPYTKLDEAIEAGIYVDGVFTLSSQAQFKRYIGKCAGVITEAKGPEMVVLYESATGIDKYRKQLDLTTIDDVLSQDGEARFFTGTSIDTPEKPWEQNCYHVKTFEGSPAETIRFQIADTNALIKECKESQSGTTKGVYYAIYTKKGNKEGNDKITEAHIGNQIAWELLGLGYTVLYKVLDSTKSATTQLRDPDFWVQFKNKSTYRFRYLTAGGSFDTKVFGVMSDVVAFNNKVTLEDAGTYMDTNGRGDAILLCDINENLRDDANNILPASEAKTQQELISRMGKAAAAISSELNANAPKYTAIFAPTVTYTMVADPDFNGNTTFPASFHYLACAATAQQRYAEWYAVAGYTRGISTKVINHTSLTFGEIAINTLAPRVANTYTKVAINLILTERGNYYLWGNRTALPLDDDGLIFSHFLNIRQLCTTIKQVLYTASRQFTFDPNSDLLWLNFLSAVRPTLERMKSDQGVNGYSISRVATDKKAVLKANIRIVPVEALEDFDISIFLEDSLSGITVSADEEVAGE